MIIPSEPWWSFEAGCSSNLPRPGHQASEPVGSRDCTVRSPLPVGRAIACSLVSLLKGLSANHLRQTRLIHLASAVFASYLHQTIRTAESLENYVRVIFETPTTPQWRTDIPFPLPLSRLGVFMLFTCGLEIKTLT